MIQNPYQNTAPGGPYLQNQSPTQTAFSTSTGTWGWGGYVVSDKIGEDPIVISWYNAGIQRYEFVRCTSDEEAIERVQALLTNSVCSQILVYELTHQWEKSWGKKRRKGRR